MDTLKSIPGKIWQDMYFSFRDYAKERKIVINHETYTSNGQTVADILIHRNQLALYITSVVQNTVLTDNDFDVTAEMVKAIDWLIREYWYFVNFSDAELSTTMTKLLDIKFENNRFYNIENEVTDLVQTWNLKRDYSIACKEHASVELSQHCISNLNNIVMQFV
jgi:hypothetical protein